MYHLRALWWKLYPPPIPSPYLHDPKFARELEKALGIYVKGRSKLIAFGHLHGWTTDIIKRNKSPNAGLKVYDIILAQGVIEMNIWNWLQQPLLHEFGFMYVDVGNTEVLLKELWSVLHRQISTGSLILFEGATRMRLTIPHRVIISRSPGLGLLLP